MEDPTETFKAWLKTRRLKANEVCKDLRVSEQTIHNWFSIGVPKRRWAEIEDFMANWKEETATALPGIEQPLTITPSREQFREWNRAATDRGMLVEDWAIEGLDQLAKEHFEAAAEQARRDDVEAFTARTRLKVAEEPVTYKVKKKTGEAGQGN